MFETIVRYKSNNERAIFDDYHELWDSALVSAHLLANSKKRVPKLLADLIEERSLSYYIDPILAEFRQGKSFRYENGNLRQWHSAYASELGDPFKRLLDDPGTVNARFLQTGVIQQIAQDAIEFQETILYDRLEANLGKYEELDIGREEAKPDAVIPWGHKLETQQDYDAFETILEASKAQATRPLRPVVYTSTGTIARGENRTELVQLLNNEDIGECFLLFEDLDKHDTTESEYKHIIDFVYDLSSAGIDPYFYYGDFFANLLHDFGLQGAAYGTIHGEQYRESVKPKTSSGMSSRYYLDKAKDFLQIQAVVDIMTRADEPVCECQFCSQHFDDWLDLAELDEAEDDETALQTVVMKHRILKRWEHARLVEETGVEDVVEDLQEDFKDVSGEYSSSQQVASRKTLQYIQRWRQAVENRTALPEN
ncbi:hypothetical protein [Haloarcula marismortui]|uniref:Uncharacterized protein n=1 Tax=Haloarcula marismortui ATCC 33800 TaxID=662476 RepID=M0JNE6_9EURY|nr:hypothetical protein [Haloarcula sinaiiensis]EMA09210.1 hypothetical protein C436_19373 [Haloarcula sinaiiensis ATCC 33800]QUJ74232.1 hypothetical protein KDQ40_17400 [Haloarcula sinaiiensis ATCC 33800]